MGWDGLNRRKFPRVVCPCLIKIHDNKTKDNIILTHTENIGVGGACVIVKSPIDKTARVEIVIDLLDTEDALRLNGKIAWIEQRKNSEAKKPLFYNVGIEFVEIPTEHKKRLETVVKNLIKKGATVLRPVY